MSQTLNISVTAEISRLTAALEKAGNLTKREINDIVKGTQRNIRQAERAAKQAAKSSELVESASDAAQKAAEMMGGAWGDVSDTIFDLGPKVSAVAAALGPVGTAAVAAAAAIGGIGVATYAAIERLSSLADQGVEAAEQLRASWSDMTPGEALAEQLSLEPALREIDAYTLALQELEREHQATLVRMGAEQSDLGLGWRAFTQSFGQTFSGVVDSVVEFGLNLAFPAVMQNLRQLGGVLKDTALDADDLAQRAHDAAQALRDIVAEQIEIDRYAGSQAQERDMLVALGLVMSPEQEAELDRQTDERKRLREHERHERERDAQERFRALQDEVRHELALLDIKQRGQQRAAELSQQLADDEIATQERVRAARFAIYREEVAQLEQVAQEHAAKLQQLSQLAQQIAQEAVGAVVSLVDLGTSRTIELYERQIAAGRELSAEDRRRYYDALVRRREAAVLEVLVSAAVAYAGMSAQLAPTLGPAAPALAATVVGLGIVAPLAEILGQPISWGVDGSYGGGSRSPYPEDDTPGVRPPSSFGFEEDVSGSTEGDGFDATDIPFLGGLIAAIQSLTKKDDGSGASTSRSSAPTVSLDTRTRQLRIVSEPPGKSQRGKR